MAFVTVYFISCLLLLVFLVTVRFIILCVSTLTLWIEFIFRFELWLNHVYELGQSMVSFFILADGTIAYDAYSTLVRWSRVTLCVCYQDQLVLPVLLFYQELRRDGLWDCPQLIGYSWWGCEYNMYCCWQSYTFNFWDKLMYVSYTTDQPGSSVGRPGGAIAFICLWIL